MAKRERKNARLQTNFKAETQAVTDVEQAGNKTIPEGGEALPADAGVPAGEQADPVQNDPAEPPAAGAGDDPAADPVAAVEEPALDVGNEAALAQFAEDAASFGTGFLKVDADGTATAVHPADVAAALIEEVGIESTARMAALRAYVGVAMQIGADKIVDPSKAFSAAADFILAERTSPAEAIPIQLALKKLGGSMSPQAQEVMLWSVFRDVFLRVFDHLKAIDDAEAAKATQEPAGGLPLDRALQPEPGPFDPASGLAPRA